MPKLLYAEIFSDYEICMSRPIPTLRHQQKCTNSLKIVNCKEHKSQNFEYSLKYTKIQIRPYM